MDENRKEIESKLKIVGEFTTDLLKNVEYLTELKENVQDNGQFNKLNENKVKKNNILMWKTESCQNESSKNDDFIETFINNSKNTGNIENNEGELLKLEKSNRKSLGIDHLNHLFETLNIRSINEDKGIDKVTSDSLQNDEELHEIEENTTVLVKNLEENDHHKEFLQKMKKMDQTMDINIENKEEESSQGCEIMTESKEIDLKVKNHEESGDFEEYDQKMRKLDQTMNINTENKDKELSQGHEIMANSKEIDETGSDLIRNHEESSHIEENDEDMIKWDQTMDINTENKDTESSQGHEIMPESKEIEFIKNNEGSSHLEEYGGDMKKLDETMNINTKNKEEEPSQYHEIVTQPKEFEETNAKSMENHEESDLEEHNRRMAILDETVVINTENKEEELSTGHETVTQPKKVEEGSAIVTESKEIEETSANYIENHETGSDLENNRKMTILNETVDISTENKEEQSSQSHEMVTQPKKIDEIIKNRHKMPNLNKTLVKSKENVNLRKFNGQIEVEKINETLIIESQNDEAGSSNHFVDSVNNIEKNKLLNETLVIKTEPERSKMDETFYFSPLKETKKVNLNETKSISVKDEVKHEVKDEMKDEVINRQNKKELMKMPNVGMIDVAIQCDDFKNAEKQKLHEYNIDLLKSYDKKMLKRISETTDFKEKFAAKQEHLVNLESAFSIAHQKYEHCKIVANVSKTNEEILRKALVEAEEKVKHCVSMERNIKSKMETHFNGCYAQLISQRDKYTTEFRKLNKIVKIMEIKVNSLEQVIARKCEERDNLMSILNDSVKQ